MMILLIRVVEKLKVNVSHKILTKSDWCQQQVVDFNVNNFVENFCLLLTYLQSAFIEHVFYVVDLYF